ncbi:hypothetical protein FLONG3_10183 [Fusarium longipes]|uniref:Uncharacterized protein n=1 Tax=Fusarium longipes TaxID=694270 RepID=A0A395RR92_9HYPO|nr:hypothetical protein FLONG3_10183 [Fusarium longipes]
MPATSKVAETVLCLGLALLSSPSLTAALPHNNPSLAVRDDSSPLRPIQGDRAQAFEFKFQPLLDFDTDSCYNVPAIDPDGNISEGLEPTSDVSECRQASTLDNSNVYVRGRCNRGWCAFVYSYFFQMDWAAGWPFGKWNHRYDWENVIVWAKQGEPQTVAVSCHGDYDSREVMNVLMAESPAEYPLPDWSWLPADKPTHPKVVFHKDNVRTHCFRFAKGSDEPVENDKGVWIRGGLLGWSDYDPKLRDKLTGFDFGGAHLAWHTEEDFTKQLIKSMPQAARDDEFDCAYDDYDLFPGIPKQD